jgi:excisionase family DNA binding protein
MINVDKRKGSTLMNTETYEYLITIEELFEMLSIGKNTSYRLLKTNQIKAFKIGRI